VKVSHQNHLNTLSLSAFGLYFVFNFIDRSMSNIFLLATLALCLVNYKTLIKSITANCNLVVCVILFSTYISFAGYYHNVPLHELDNYYRFLLLLPLLALSLNERYIPIVIFICAAAGLIHAINTNVFFDNTFRLQGTSSTAITYANMCATLMMVCLYYLFYKGRKSYLLALSALIFLTLLLLTETRGPIIGIVFTSIYFALSLKSSNKIKVNLKVPLLFLFIFLVTIVIVPNPLGERLKEFKNINLNEPLKTSHYYLRERIYYNIFGLEQIKNNYFKGVGPQNIKKLMRESLKNNNIDNIRTPDHLHNDLLDITLKFGITSIFLLFLMYFFIINPSNRDDKVLLTILMIMLVSSQLTQSQFAHHQAISFFITLFYLLQSKDNLSR
jgi:O-antigen ligase